MDKCTPDWTSPRDFEGVALGVLRLLRTYDLSFKDVIAGNVYGYESLRSLGVKDVLTLGRWALSMSEVGYAAQAFRTVITRTRAEKKSAVHAEAGVLLAKLYIEVIIDMLEQ